LIGLTNPTLKNKTPSDTTQQYNNIRRNYIMKSALAVLSLLAVIWKSDAFVPKAAFRKASSMCVSTATAETPLSKSAKSEPKVCLVTGSSQGIGKAIALELGRCGQKVVVNYIQGCEKDAEETVEEIKSLGGDAIAVQADCTLSYPCI
jgi:UDP-N-acetylglucosamine:LPS N-acetylglucosamine transferase